MNSYRQPKVNRGGRAVSLPAVATACLMLLAAGCVPSVQGRWRLVSAQPSRELFSIDNADFKRDGTFSATVTNDGTSTQQSGKFTYNGFRLRLKPQGGGQVDYPTVVRFGRLEITSGNRHAVLEKAR